MELGDLKKTEEMDQKERETEKEEREHQSWSKVLGKHEENMLRNETSPLFTLMMGFSRCTVLEDGL